MNTDLIKLPKYAGLYKLVSTFCKHFENLNKEDIDSFIMFVIMFGYTCKYLKTQNQEINQDNIYKCMENIWENQNSREKIIKLYQDTIQKRIN